MEFIELGLMAGKEIKRFCDKVNEQANKSYEVFSQTSFIQSAILEDDKR